MWSPSPNITYQLGWPARLLAVSYDSGKPTGMFRISLFSPSSPSLSPLFQVCVSPDHASTLVSSGLPLLTASTGAYLPDHVSQRQPCHVSAASSPRPLPTRGGPAAASLLPAASARGPAPWALPAADTTTAAGMLLPAGQRRQPAHQYIPAGPGGRWVWEHAGVPALTGATKEKHRTLAQVQTEWARGTAGLPATPGLGLAQLPVGQWDGGGRGGREHALPQHAEHKHTRALSHLQACAAHTHTDFPHTEQTHAAAEAAALTLQTGQRCPLKTQSTYPPAKSVYL